MKYALLLLLLAGCVTPPDPVRPVSDRAAQDWEAFAADGALDPTEFKMLDRDFAAMEQELAKEPPRPTPVPTGIPWLDIAMSVAGAIATGYATHKTTMYVRDRQRAGEAPAAPTSPQ